MTHGSLFSGIGGFDLAAQWAGWENVFACEIDPFCQKVLKYHFPNSTLYENIRTTDFTIWRGRIDVLSGGFPCQPFSTAGKRKGTEDDRYLWPEMLRAIREISPRWVVGENVLGIVNWNGGMVFEQVCADLEIEGYEVQPYVLPACGVGAPHQRNLVWFVAHAKGDGNSGRPGKICQTDGGQVGELFSEPIDTDNLRGDVINPDINLHIGKKSKCDGETKKVPPIYRTEYSSPGQSFRANQLNDERGDTNGYAPYSCRAKLQRGKQYRGVEGAGEIESQSGQSCRPICGKWENFPTQPPVRCGNDGIPGELDGITLSSWYRESIKSYGNAVVPLVPLQIFNAINQYEKNSI